MDSLEHVMSTLFGIDVNPRTGSRQRSHQVTTRSRISWNRKPNDAVGLSISGTTGGASTVLAGDYIVVDHDQVVSRMTDDEFRETYDKAGK